MTSNIKLGSFVNIECEIDMTVFQCGTCGVTYGVQSSFLDNRRKDKGEWRCINTNCKTIWWYGESCEEKLKKELSSTKEQLKREEIERKLNEKRARAFKGLYNQTKKKIAKGVCPCCDQVFKNVRRHMRRQHPEWEKENAF